MDKESFSFPKKVPIFPLPNVILFPNVDLPLYIFEPRYRKMLADLLKGDRMLGVALIKEGEKKEPSPVYEVCGIGIVKFSAENPDETSNIIVSGLARARIQKFVQEEPYRVGEIEILKDVTHDNPEEMALTEKVKDLFIRKVSLKKIVTDEQIDSIRLLSDPSRICDIISYYSSSPFPKKQTVLETLDVNKRLRKVLKLLEEEIRILESKN